LAFVLTGYHFFERTVRNKDLELSGTFSKLKGARLYNSYSFAKNLLFDTKGMLIRKIEANENNSDSNCEVTCILHKHEKLCIAGWNKTLVVYHMAQDGFKFLNKFRRLHDANIVSMDINNAKIATASYDGCIIIWNLEIGTPHVQINPKESIHLKFLTQNRLKKVLQFRNKSERLNETLDSSTFDQNAFNISGLLFLKSRPSDPLTANLLSAGAFGWIRAWSTKLKGKLIAQFCAAHASKDTLTAFCVCERDALLLTGSYLLSICVRAFLFNWQTVIL
jgi:hypothetical protein